MYADVRRCTQPSGLTLCVSLQPLLRYRAPCTIITTNPSYSYLPTGPILILRTSGLKEQDLKVNVS